MSRCLVFERRRAEKGGADLYNSARICKVTSGVEACIHVTSSASHSMLDLITDNMWMMGFQLSGGR